MFQNIWSGEFQNRLSGFEKEIEKYPEFQWNKSFDIEVFEDVQIVEHDKAVMQMNRLLKIILSLLITQKLEI